MIMKKWFVLILCCLLLIGCGKKEEVSTLQSDNSYYKIASPYKENVGGYSLRSYDKDNVINMLSKISKKYFKVNNSLYQEGQYLSSEEMKDLLSKEKLNATDDHFKQDLEPTFITTIYEQDYLATNGNLKGISLAIVLDNQQTYTEDGTTIIKTFDEQDVLNWGKEKATQLVEYMRSKDELKNTKIIIGLYLGSHGSLSGNFVYVGEAEKKISWDDVQYNYQWMDSQAIMERDLQNYNNILEIKNDLKEYDSISLTSYGLYQQNSLKELYITIHSNHLTTSMIMSIEEILKENLVSFDSSIPIHIRYQNSNTLKGYSEKKENSDALETYLLEG